MEDKAFAYLYDGTNQITVQKKNILEIAGQQIIGRNSKSLIVHTKSFLYIWKFHWGTISNFTCPNIIYLNFCHSLNI